MWPFVFKFMGRKCDDDDGNDNQQLICGIEKLTRQVERVATIYADDLEWRRTHAGFATTQDLREMERRQLMTSQELSVALDSQKTQLGKIAKEQSDRFDALKIEIADLKRAIEAGEVNPEVAAKFADVQTAVDNMDAAIPDATPVNA